MLPLQENKLNSDNDWHLLKNLLVSSKYLSKEEALKEYNNLPAPLKKSFVAEKARLYLETTNIKALDLAVEFLTQSKIPDAWLYIERL